MYDCLQTNRKEGFVFFTEFEAPIILTMLGYLGLHNLE